MIKMSLYVCAILQNPHLVNIPELTINEPRHAWLYLAMVIRTVNVLLKHNF